MQITESQILLETVIIGSYERSFKAVYRSCSLLPEVAVPQQPSVQTGQKA